MSKVGEELRDHIPFLAIVMAWSRGRGYEEGGWRDRSRSIQEAIFDDGALPAEKLGRGRDEVT